MAKRIPSKRSKGRDEDVARICRELLETNTPVSARRVARESGLSVTSITRSPIRMKAVADAVAFQERLTEWSRRRAKASDADLLEALAAKDQKIASLEQQVALLTASHKAMILAVGELGGYEAWRRFFVEWNAAGSEVLQFPPAGRRRRS